MLEASKYAKEAIKTLKVSEINPFDEIKALGTLNNLDICKGIYTAWEVLELMLMLDYLLQQQKTGSKREK